MDLKLAKKRVLVQGSSSGLGFAIAQGFAREGALVAICSRDEERVGRAAQQIPGAVRFLIRSLGRIARWDDPHNLHAFQNLFAEEFRLRKVGADNDALAAADYFLKLIFSCLMGRELRDRFWQIHSHEIVQTVSSAIGTPEIPIQEVRDWWLECIAGLDLPDARKAVLKDELALAESTPGAYSHKFVRGMLLGMGILTIRQA